jgi:ABC-type transporter MlaC component
MKASVELIYKVMPSDRELENIRDAGYRLTSNPKSVSVQVLEKGDRYPVVLEFTMRTEAQYKVVDRVADEVRRWLMEPYEDMGIRFGK